MRDRAAARASQTRLPQAAITERSVPLDKESESAHACEQCRRDPSGSLTETGPFSFLVIIEIESQVLLLSRGAPLALITRCLADLCTRTPLRSVALSSRGTNKTIQLFFNPYWYGMDIFLQVHLCKLLKTIDIFLSDFFKRT